MYCQSECGHSALPHLYLGRSQTPDLKCITDGKDGPYSSSSTIYRYIGLCSQQSTNDVLVGLVARQSLWGKKSCTR